MAIERISPSPELRQRSDGRVLIGGNPLRILRLSAAGAGLSRSWFAGGIIDPKPSHQSLAVRLIDAGMASAVFSWPEPAFPADVTVVVPVKDDEKGLIHTLTPLTSLSVVVVDDGSAQPISLDRLPQSGSNVVLLRRPSAAGPGIARNHGLTEVATPVVAFVDAGVEVTAADLMSLSAQLMSDSPSQSPVVAIAPRVVVPVGDGTLEHYEQKQSPLDLGDQPATVGVGRAVAYVPTACLVVRTDAMAKADGFDEALRYGEDVDLVWRLIGDGGTVRYEPTVRATHPARSSVAGFIRQRVSYGSAAGPLSERHGDAVAPMRLSAWSLGVAGLLFGGRPLSAIGLAAGTAVALAPKLGDLPDRNVEAALLATRGHLWATRSTATESLRTWWPLTALALGHRRSRRLALRLIAGATAEQALRHRDGPLAAVLLGLVDDLSYGTGVWKGAISRGTLKPLLPSIVNWPPKER